MLSYTDAKKKLIELAEDQLPEGFVEHAEAIVNLHLRDDTLAMPDMTDDDVYEIKQKIREGHGPDELAKLVKLEPTETKFGMFRVLARTQLNRQYIGQVTIGAIDPTRTPRVMELLPQLDIDTPISEADNQKKLLEEWLNFASQKRYQNIENNARFYSPEAIRTLEIIHHSCPLLTPPDIGPSAKIRHRAQGGMESWWKIALGLISGLHFLQEREWDCFEAAHTEGLQADAIIDLIKQCSKSVHEFGKTLAGSFYADLGGSAFVKPDTHVIDCLRALGYEEGKELGRILRVLEIANHNAQSPRVVDKLLYITCSGKFPLVDLKFRNPQITKHQFLGWLEENRG